MPPTISVIIPTYNRRAILQKALTALSDQDLPPDQYEVILIDDGSTDGTEQMVTSTSWPFRLHYEKTARKGPASARNLGIKRAQGTLIVFIDSDIVVNKTFLSAHLAAHTEPHFIGHGPVIHTDNLDDPTAAEMKITDISRAFFATGNASIRREHLIAAGLFDEEFVEYGWEDLELGLRLRKRGLKAVKVPNASGFHYKKRLEAADVPYWCQRERERGHTAVIFYRKQPTRRVKMMTMITPIAFWIDRILTIGGWPKKQSTMRLLQKLEKRGRHLVLRFVVRIMTFHAYMDGIREALAQQNAT